MTRRERLLAGKRLLASGDYVHVHDSHIARGSTGGYVQVVFDGAAHVRLELDDDHPAMAEAIADTGLPGDQVELVEVVPLDNIQFPDGTTVDVAGHAAAEDQRAREAADRQRRARIDAIRASGDRLTLPDLDAGLRTKKR